MGANTLRIFFPFGQVTDADGNFLPEPGNPAVTTLDHLEAVLALADEQGVRASIVLFGPDACGGRTGCWSAAQERFVTAMAAQFRERAQLAYWSTVNEINDRQWGAAQADNPANADLRLAWHRQIAATLRAHDPNHLISASVQTDAGDGTVERYHDYFRPISGSPEDTLANMVDFLTPHSFLGVKRPNQVMVLSLQARATGKPIVLEEIGWPTGQSARNEQFTDETQAAVIGALLAAAAGAGVMPGVAGVGVWMLVDFNDAPDLGQPEQPYFGLFWSEYTAAHQANGVRPPQAWARKPAADLVQRHFQVTWPE
ncbi:MAG: cellulase family glycosylhydrolase [Chloroflexi bacterium]|nr:cellulase family glycosylhydrolase [Chloroflexota bacterium]